MNSTYDPAADRLQSSAEDLGRDIKKGAKNVQGAASSEIQNLIADVEDLMAKVANLKDADVTRVRGRVEQALSAAKRSLSTGTETVRRQVRETAASADDYVHDSPWQALGLAALAGVIVGVLVARRS
jgi:ElaB/YqjD/DUF883 family membrane-anchored ribosome-binding protein